MPYTKCCQWSQWNSECKISWLCIPIQQCLLLLHIKADHWWIPVAIMERHSQLVTHEDVFRCIGLSWRCLAMRRRLKFEKNQSGLSPISPPMGDIYLHIICVIKFHDTPFWSEVFCLLGASFAGMEWDAIKGDLHNTSLTLGVCGLMTITRSSNDEYAKLASINSDLSISFLSLSSLGRREKLPSAWSICQLTDLLPIRMIYWSSSLILMVNFRIHSCIHYPMILYSHLYGKCYLAVQKVFI